MNNKDGRSIETAIKVEDCGSETNHRINTLIEEIIGGDGDYFILSETTVENPEKTKRYKVMFVEDNIKNEKYSLFFDIS